jgi:GT2 family glycosyltransferase
VRAGSTTVIVTTLFRHDDLRACLDALTRLDLAPDGLIVVCRRDDAASAEIARAGGARVVSADTPGVARAIEVGLGAVTTDIAAFVDDDARPHADWLRRIRDHFAAAPELGFLGGRDNVFGDAESGSLALPVGLVRAGKMIGNHHLGHGEFRSAHHVKGANMAFRLEAVRDVPLAQLVAGEGAQHGVELFLCFAALRRGYSGGYDPRVQVDHYPAARQSDDGRLDYNPRRVRLNTRNKCVASGLFLPPAVLVAVVLRSIFLGDRAHPGFACAAALAVKRRPFFHALRANLLGICDYAGQIRQARLVSLEDSRRPVWRRL